MQIECQLSSANRAAAPAGVTVPGTATISWQTIVHYDENKQNLSIISEPGKNNSATKELKKRRERIPLRREPLTLGL
jgi:hypothetical protein